MNILVFAPHPDDDVIGCGGSIRKHIDASRDVHIAYLTSGEAGHSTISKETLAALREEEAKDAAEVLGVPKENLTFFRQPDGYLTYGPETLVWTINLIRHLRPQVVYLPHEQDGHADHRETYQIVREAIVRASGPWFQECKGVPWLVSTILAYEVWTPIQAPQYVEDISEVAGAKFRALRKHKTQIEGIAYDDAIQGLSLYRGIMKGIGKHAECFQVLHISSII